MAKILNLKLPDDRPDNHGFWLTSFGIVNGTIGADPPEGLESMISALAAGGSGPLIYLQKVTIRSALNSFTAPFLMLRLSEVIGFFVGEPESVTVVPPSLRPSY
jgi:hypothetical protein